MDNAETIVALLNGRFDSLERRLDQQRGAMEAQADSFNHLAAHVGKQNGRVGKVEDWIKHHEHTTERREESRWHRLGRWATVLSALFGSAAGGAAVWGLTLLTGSR